MHGSERKSIDSCRLGHLHVDMFCISTVCHSIDDFVRQSCRIRPGLSIFASKLQRKHIHHNTFEHTHTKKKHTDTCVHVHTYMRIIVTKNVHHLCLYTYGSQWCHLCHLYKIASDSMIEVSNNKSTRTWHRSDTWCVLTRHSAILS